MLADAKDAQDRVAALTKTVHAYEDGLAALRTGMRQAAIQEQAISADLETRREDVAQLLGVLSTLSRAPTPLLLLHPTGPTGTARSGMMLSEVTQGLQARAEALRLELEEVMILRDIQANAAATLVDGLTGAQQARVTLRTAMSDRTDLPRKFIEDSEQTALLIASSETLDAFASALVAQPLGDTAPTGQLGVRPIAQPSGGIGPTLCWRGGCGWYQPPRHDHGNTPPRAGHIANGRNCAPCRSIAGFGQCGDSRAVARSSFDPIGFGRGLSRYRRSVASRGARGPDGRRRRPS